MDGDRTVGFDALVADNDEPGGKLPRGLNEWVADIISTGAERRA